MSNFTLWFDTGFHHIMDWAAYDHICYIVALSIVFTWSQWRMLALVITAFTIGHSVSLALSAFGVLRIPSSIIEILIPLTIVFTVVYNFINRKNAIKHAGINYAMALFFGCIHGLGFSYLLKSMLGREESIIGPLFSFNIGIEAAQLLIVTGVLLFSFVLERIVKISKTKYISAVSLATLCAAGFMIVERIKEF